MQINFLKISKKQYGEDLGWQCTVNMSDVGMMIEDAPTADVVEVKHGEWLEGDSDVGWELVRCSLCGKEQSLFQDEEKPSYCPRCGAKMNGNNLSTIPTGSEGRDA